jgi:cell division protease FtsH
MNNNPKNLFIFIAIFIVLVTLFNFTQSGGLYGSPKQIKFSEFITKVEAGQISTVNITDRMIDGTMSDGSSFTTHQLNYPNLLEKLYKSGVSIDASSNEKMSSFVSILVSWFPMLLFIGVWIFFMRQMGGGAGKAMGFGKSKAKLLSDKGAKVKFKDVAGIEEAKEELSEIVDFLRDPGKFHRLGGKIPKGCLLVGPPGTGKTLLAKAIAGEANVPFFSISGSDFVEMFVGVGASRVRDMFEQGKKNAPCIIFIDEIDAVGRSRGVGLGGGNDEREQTLNQLLVEMDGFEANEGVIIIAATNRPDVLDKALLRPGRFDRQITVSNPDIEGRDKILNVHASKVKLDVESVDLKRIAKGTPGFSGAELANLINEAALLAARRGKRQVEMIDLEDAKDKVMMGPERRSMIMSKDEIKLTAYHEAGHALVALNTPGADPIYKATIIPRGSALGMVQPLSKEGYSISRMQIEAKIALFMGGRAAEEIIFGYENVTTGAVGDIRGATYWAKRMVKESGLSDLVGNVDHGSSNDAYAGRGAFERSEKTAELIDSEVKRLIDEGYNNAAKILKKNLDKLHLLANALIEHETLTGEQINNLLAGKSIDAKPSGSKKSKKDDDVLVLEEESHDKTKEKKAESAKKISSMMKTLKEASAKKSSAKSSSKPKTKKE